jgi:hypothetical protein
LLLQGGVFQLSSKFHLIALFIYSGVHIASARPISLVWGGAPCCPKPNPYFFVVNLRTLPISVDMALRI